jgi:hypothetical protein
MILNLSSYGCIFVVDERRQRSLDFCSEDSGGDDGHADAKVIRFLGGTRARLLGAKIGSIA